MMSESRHVQHAFSLRGMSRGGTEGSFFFSSKWTYILPGKEIILLQGCLRVSYILQLLQRLLSWIFI